MTQATVQYNPDYATPPGWVLEEELESRGISQAEFARRCGRSAKLISEIVAGKAPIEPETAIQFDRVLGGGPGIWLRMESTYRLRLAQQIEAANAVESASWARGFPIKELVSRGVIVKPSSIEDTVAKLLAFFGVGSVEAWHVKYATSNFSYRHSPAFESDEATLATWLRLGEIDAENTECPNYNQTRFKQSLRRIRAATASPTIDALAEAKSLCNHSGVVLSLVKPLPKAALSGAVWWSSPRKAIIQLSARHLADDHLWFSFFHEAAHILLHSKKDVFIDVRGNRTGNSRVTPSDAEADAWAANFLAPSVDWEKFVASFGGTAFDVQEFAEQQGIAPGVVVGRLQHEGHLAWDRLNHLKTRLQWK